MSPMKFLFGLGQREHSSGNPKYRIPVFALYYANRNHFVKPGLHFQYAHPGTFPGLKISSWRILPLPAKRKR